MQTLPIFTFSSASDLTFLHWFLQHFYLMMGFGLNNKFGQMLMDATLTISESIN